MPDTNTQYDKEITEKKSPYRKETRRKNAEKKNPKTQPKRKGAKIKYT